MRLKLTTARDGCYHSVGVLVSLAPDGPYIYVAVGRFRLVLRLALEGE